MRAGWKSEKLENVSQFLNGLWKGEAEPLVHVGVIRNTNFTKDGILDYSDIAYLDVEQKKFAKRQLEYGDIILEKSGGGPKQAVGRVVVFDKKEGDFSFSNFTSAIRIINKDELDFHFLHKFLYWNYVSGVTEKMQSNSTGIRNLDGNAYKAINLQFPALFEQQRIVAILDQAFEGITKARANAEQNLQNARALFESHLQSVFVDATQNNTLVALSDLATDITDGDHMPPPKAETGVPFITIGNIVKHTRTIDFTDTFKVPAEYFNKLKANKKPKLGDVLYTVTGSFGIPVLVKNNQEFCFQRHIGLIRPKHDVSSEWLCYLLSSPQLLKQANDGATGTAQKTVSLRVLRSFQVPRLSLENQNKIVIELDALSKETQHLEAIYQRIIALLEELKKSLLQQAFAGKL